MVGSSSLATINHMRCDTTTSHHIHLLHLCDHLRPANLRADGCLNNKIISAQTVPNHLGEDVLRARHPHCHASTCVTMLSLMLLDCSHSFLKLKTPLFPSSYTIHQTCPRLSICGTFWAVWYQCIRVSGRVLEHSDMGQRSTSLNH